MSTLRWGGCIILTLAFVTAGCGSKAGQADRLRKDQIAVLVEMAEAYEGVTNKQSFIEAQKKIDTLFEKYNALETQFNAMEAEVKASANSGNDSQMKEVNGRLATAKLKASKSGR